MEFFNKIFTQLRTFFTRLPPGRRAAAVMTAIAVATSMVALLFWTGGTDYQTLYSNLASEDATAIMRLLREKKIPFKVDQDGRTIKIPPEAVYDL